MKSKTLDDLRLNDPRWTKVTRPAIAVIVGIAAATVFLAPSSVTAASDTASNLSGRYLSARHALQEKDTATAARMFTQVLATDPENSALLQRTFFALISSGQTEKAVDLARRLVKENPRDSVASIVLALNEMRSGNYDEALKKLNKASRSRFNGLIVPLVEAWGEIGAGSPDKALKALDALKRRKAYGLFKNYHVALINDLIGKNELAEAAYQLSIAQRSGPSLRNVEIYGSFLERSGRANEALVLYRKFLERDVDNPLVLESITRVEKGGKAKRRIKDALEGTAEALHGVASVLVPKNGADQALIYLNMALFLKPEFPAAQSLLGGIYETQRRWSAANEVYKGIEKTSAYGWNARIRMASNMDRVGKTDDAVRMLRKLSSDYPTRLDALSTLGSILRFRKRFDEAIGVYDEAISRLGEPRARDWTLYYARGISLEQRNIWNRAEADFLKALELQPEQPSVLNYLGYSWVEKNLHLDKAQKMIERAVELRPRDGYIVDSLGWVLYRLGDYAGAVIKLERAVALQPEDAIINEHLGDAMWQTGRRREARFQWRHALSLKPDSKNADALKLKIEKGLDAVPADNANQ